MERTIANEDVVYFDTEEGATLFDGAGVRGHFWTICRYFVSEKFLTYKAPPCWVKAAVLHKAMGGIDITSQKSRGFLVVHRPGESVIANS